MSHPENCECVTCRSEPIAHAAECGCAECIPKSITHAERCQCPECSPPAEGHSEGCACPECSPQDIAHADQCECLECQPAHVTHADTCACVECSTTAVPSSRMHLKEESRSGVMALVLEGKFDSVAAAEYGDQMISILEDNPSVLLDLQAVSYMASTGLRILIQMAKRSKTSGKTFRLTGVQPMVRDVLEMSGMINLFEMT